MENTVRNHASNTTQGIKNQQLDGKSTPLHKDESNIEFLKKQGVPGFGGEADSHGPGGPKKDTSGEKVNDPNDLTDQQRQVVAEKKREALEQDEKEKETTFRRR